MEGLENSKYFYSNNEKGSGSDKDHSDDEGIGGYESEDDTSRRCVESGSITEK